MKIIFRTKLDRALVLSFGYNTELFASMYWFDATTEYYDEFGIVIYAKMHISLFKHIKYWFK